MGPWELKAFHQNKKEHMKGMLSFSEKLKAAAYNYTSHVDGPGLGRSKMLVILSTGPIRRALRGNLGHFWLKAGQTFVAFGAEGGKLRGVRGSRTLGMDPHWVDGGLKSNGGPSLQSIGPKH